MVEKLLNLLIFWIHIDFGWSAPDIYRWKTQRREMFARSSVKRSLLFSVLLSVLFGIGSFHFHICHSYNLSCGFLDDPFWHFSDVFQCGINICMFAYSIWICIPPWRFETRQNFYFENDHHNVEILYNTSCIFGRCCLPHTRIGYNAITD